MSPRWAAALMAALFAGQVSRATAEPFDEDKLVASARKACLAGNVETGIEQLAILYLQTLDANYIYNQARCYEQNGKYEPAIARYREYLRKESAPEMVRTVEANIARLEQALDWGRVPPGAVPAAAVPAAAAPPPVAPAPPPVAAALVGPADRSLPALSGSPGIRAAGISLAGAGLAALGLGVVQGLRRNAAVRDLEADASAGRAFDAARYQTGKSAARLATAGLLAAPALLLAGGVSWWLGRPRSGGPPRTALLTDGSSVSMWIRF